MPFLDYLVDPVDILNSYELENGTTLLSPTDYENIPMPPQELPPRNYAQQIIRSGGRSLYKLNPWWVTGFVDAEGSFGINNTTSNTGSFKIGLQFKVSQNAPNRDVIEKLIDYFGGGKVHVDKASTNTLKFQIQDLPSIREKVYPHFSKYPLITSKQLDYNDWLEAIKLLINKEHFTPEGKDMLIDLKSKINNGRPKEERWEFLKNIGNTNVLHPDWVRGFIDGEASFQFGLSERRSRGTSYIHANPTMEIAQSNHDVAILDMIKRFLDSGYIKPNFNTSSWLETLNSRSTSRFVTNEESKVIQFIDKYPLITTKYLDYLDWKKLIEMKEQGLHKTEQGRSSMSLIKSSMNSGRKFS